MARVETTVEVPDGARYPSLKWAPAEPVGTLGHEAIELAELCGMKLDLWQQDFLNQALSVNPDKTFYNEYTGRVENRWATSENGLIVARQNGKSAIFEVRELSGLFLFGERIVIHSAHRSETAQEQFVRIKELIEGVPEFDQQIKKVMDANGKEGIYLKSGQRLLFKTRTASGGRGFSADCVVYDEAMILGESQIAASMPTLRARPNPHIFYGASAGNRDVQDCSHLGRLRKRALAGDDPYLFFEEFSIDACDDFCPDNCKRHDDPADPASWAKANPGLGIRIEPDSVEREMLSMGGPRSRAFLTEILSVGLYPVEGAAWQVIPKSAWDRRTDEGSELKGNFALSVDVTPDRSYSCLAVSGPSTTDRLDHVEVIGSGVGDEALIGSREGTQWVVPRVIQIWKSQKPACVVIDPVGHAGSFIDELVQAGVNVISPSAREYGQACGEFRSAVCPAEGEAATLVHIGQKALSDALAHADKRRLTDMWVWDKRSSEADISPIVAATLAHWGYRKHVYTSKPPYKPRFFFA